MIHRLLLLLLFACGVVCAQDVAKTASPTDRVTASPATALQALARTAAPIRAGDTINVTLKEDKDIRYEGEVSSEGLIDVKYLGRFPVVGRTPEQAEKALGKALEKDLYVKATVAVTVVKRAPAFVYIYGAGKDPGKVTLPQNQQMTILQALSEVNGITTWATPRESYILRVKAGDGKDKDKPERIAIDIFKAFKDVASKENHKLLPNDIIVVPSATGTDTVLSVENVEVIVTGQVEKPGLVTFAPGEQRSFIRAVFKAGNFTRFAKRDKVRFIRYVRGKKREVKVVNAERIIDKGFLEEDFELQAGDMIIVDEKRFNF